MGRRGKVIFLDEDKKLGHTRVSQELFDELNELAKELKMSRSGLARRVLESFAQYMNDAQAFKKLTMFNKKPTVETLLNERNDVREMLIRVQEYSDKIQSVKTPDEKIQLVAAQNVIVAEMINLVHKTTMT